MFDVLQNETLSSMVSRELIRSIVSDRIAPGQLLPTEEQLCRQFGVSRSVVREAMKTVQSIGLAKSRQGQGTVVLPVTSWNNFSVEVLQARRDTGTIHDILAEFLELRTIIEVRAAGIAAARANEENLDRLSALANEMTAAVGNAAEFIVLDIEFHNEIFRSTSNHMIVNLFKLLNPVLTVAREIGFAGQPQPRGMKQAVSEHARILESIRIGSESEARNAMSDHLIGSARREARDLRITSP